MFNVIVVLSLCPYSAILAAGFNHIQSAKVDSVTRTLGVMWGNNSRLSYCYTLYGETKLDLPSTHKIIHLSN